MNGMPNSIFLKDTSPKGWWMAFSVPPGARTQNGPETTFLPDPPEVRSRSSNPAQTAALAEWATKT